MKNLRFMYFVKLSLFALFIFSSVSSVNAQKMDRIERERMKSVLNNIKKDIIKNYYDANYHGIDVEARFDKAEKRIDEIETIAEAFAVIAQALMDFNDSHLFFIPPETTIDVEYGFKMKLIGDKSYVYAVKPKSDAEKQGLKIGDQILLFEGFRPTKKDLWKMDYYYNILSPRTKLKLRVLHPNAAEPQDIEFNAKITEKKRVADLSDSMDVNDLIRQSERKRAISYSNRIGETVVWKLNTFSFNPSQADQMLEEATKGRNLVIDLRGNGGGYVKNLEKIAGHFFDKDMQIAERKGREEKRKENEPMMTKTPGKNTYTGKVVVLVDSESGSASEILARFFQLEKRATIVGDVSAGAVMQSIGKGGKVGVNRQIFYSTSITNADVIMSDGKSLEHTGVTPDVLVIPTPTDLAKGYDPAMARALELVGVSVSPEQAGKIFPNDEWEDQ